MKTAKAQAQAPAQEPPRKRTRCKTSPVPKPAEEPAGAQRRKSSAPRGTGQEAAAARAPAGTGASASSTAPAATAPAPAAPAAAPAAAASAAPAPAATASAAPVAGSGGQRPVNSQGLTFLRLSSDCSHSTLLKSLVYLNSDEVTLGRLPTCNFVLDSTRVPQMISRVHGKLLRTREEGGAERWAVVDNKSLNGILVNNEKIEPEDPHALQPGDVITFGRKIWPPEFEFVFEAPLPEPAAAEQASAVDEAMQEQMERIAKLEEELQQEREQQRVQREQKRGSRSSLDLADLHSDMCCSVCQDWLVFAATLECAHSFCWSCIDTWLVQKHFECPICRAHVVREPVKNLAMDNLVRKAVERGTEKDRQEYNERIASAESAKRRAQKLHADLARSVADAQQKGKNFFSIDTAWSRKERETFAKGVKDYSGNTREEYCKLTGLTVQWVHTADSTKLNRALHNLGLQKIVDKSDDDIRQRLLMYLRYG